MNDVAGVVYGFGDGFELDEALCELRHAGERVPIQPKVLALLLHLVRARERMVPKEELLGTLWPGIRVTENSIARAVMEARRAIGDDAQTAIETVRGRGFRFALPVDSRSVAKPLTTLDPTFVGRTACLQAFGSRLRAAEAGRASVAWLVGEAGMGKTRTAQHFAAIARSAGAWVVTTTRGGAEGDSLAERFVDPLRAVAEGEPLARALLRALAEAQEGAGNVGGSTARELGQALELATRERPLVLILDDLHAADRASLRVLDALVAAGAERRLFVVGAFRDAPTPEASPALDALARFPAALTIPLRGLARDEVEALARLETGTEPSVQAVDSLLRRSAGNPAHLHELLHARWMRRPQPSAHEPIESTIDLHATLVRSIAEHFESLSPGAAELLHAAASLGVTFDVAELSAVSGRPSSALMDTIEEAERARMLVQSEPGRFAFRVPLARDVLYRRSTSAERARRHLAILDALEAHYGRALEPHVDRLADHAWRARPLVGHERLISLCLRAADRAEALADDAAAVVQLRRAVEAMGASGLGDDRRPAAQLRLAGRVDALGDRAAARAAYLDAALLARAAADRGAFDVAVAGYRAITADADVRAASLFEWPA